MPEVEVKKGLILDLLPDKSPALSSTDDMPVVETRPDASPAPEAVPPPEDGGEAEQLDESATSTTDQDSPGQPTEPEKAARGVGKKIQELTRLRDEERRRADAAEARLDRALAALEAGTGKSAVTAKAEIDAADPEPSKPAKSDFSDPDAWDAALSDYAEQKAAWTARREVKAQLAEEQRKRTEAEIAEGQRRTTEVYQQRITKAREKHPDFAEVAESPDVQISVPMAHAIMHSEDGPEIQYYLGKNPAEAQRISELAPPLQLVELGKIVARLNAPPPPKPPVSNAPKPITPIKSGEGSIPKSPEDESMEEYAARRKQELARDMRH